MTHGPISLTRALVLSRREHKETDRIAFLYTADYGKVPVRFPGANRSQGKLKALSEPMSAGEYRLHVRRGAEFATAAGGSLETTFPGLRADLEASLRGLEACELLEAVAPAWQPNPAKLELALGCLGALERSAMDGRPAPWVPLAYALRLMESAGFGATGLKVREESRELWEALHGLDFGELLGLPDDPGRRLRLEGFLERLIGRVLERPLRTARVRRGLLADAAEVQRPI